MSQACGVDTDTTRWAIGPVQLGRSHRGCETWGQDRDIHNKAERTTTDHDHGPWSMHAVALWDGDWRGPDGGVRREVPRIQLRARPPGASPSSATPCFPSSAQHSPRWHGRWHPRFLPSSSSVGAFVLELGDPLRASQIDTTTTTPHPPQPRLSRGRPAALTTTLPESTPRVPSPSPRTDRPDCLCTLLRPVVCCLPPPPPAAAMALHSSARSSPPVWIAR
jgi:hypothetical protein